MRPTQVMRSRAEKAFVLYKTLVAWRIHAVSRYDAWEYNFNTNMKFSTFLGNCFTKGHPTNEAYRAASILEIRGIGVEEYIPYIVVTCDSNTHNNITMAIPAMVKRYQAWKERKPPEPLEDRHLEIVDGYPKILHPGLYGSLEAAEMLSIAGRWDDLLKLKGESNFMFEVRLPKLYKYRGLYPSTKDTK